MWAKWNYQIHRLSNYILSKLHNSSILFTQHCLQSSHIWIVVNIKANGDTNSAELTWESETIFSKLPFLSDWVRSRFRYVNGIDHILDRNVDKVVRSSGFMNPKAQVSWSLKMCKLKLKSNPSEFVNKQRHLKTSARLCIYNISFGQNDICEDKTSSCPLTVILNLYLNILWDKVQFIWFIMNFDSGKTRWNLTWEYPWVKIHFEEIFKRFYDWSWCWYQRIKLQVIIFDNI